MLVRRVPETISFLLLFIIFIFYEHWCFACGISGLRVSDPPGSGVIHTCELLCGCWELKQDPLEEQPVRSERSLQPLGTIFKERFFFFFCGV